MKNYLSIVPVSDRESVGGQKEERESKNKKRATRGKGLEKSEKLEKEKRGGEEMGQSRWVLMSNLTGRGSFVGERNGG